MSSHVKMSEGSYINTSYANLKTSLKQTYKLNYIGNNRITTSVFPRIWCHMDIQPPTPHWLHPLYNLWQFILSHLWLGLLAILDSYKIIVLDSCWCVYFYARQGQCVHEAH